MLASRSYGETCGSAAACRRFSFVYNFLPRLKEVGEGEKRNSSEKREQAPALQEPQEDASGTRRSFVPQKRKSPDRSSRPCRDRFGAIEPTYKKSVLGEAGTHFS